MALETYRRKRRFRRTPEPEGRDSRQARGWRFVVQKHAASRLHYDFRLELDGVLKSWAVPKGPSYVPSERRLAIHVEDHPLEYADFEGVIPEGEYGGGVVMLWDRGRWRPQGDAKKEYARGHLKFVLEGEKLRGGWALVRMEGREEGGKEQWLLIKERDAEARSRSEPDILEEDRSAGSGRTMEEIGAARDRVWRSEGAVVGEKAVGAVEGARKGRLPAPGSTSPELATLVDRVPSGEAWLHEIKFDGYRVLCRLGGGRARLLTRGGKDWTDRFPPVADAARGLAATSALLDGEVVVLDASGVSDFQRLQNALGAGDAGLVYYVFDLPYLEGHDLSRVPLVRRKELLRDLLVRSSTDDRIRFSDHVVGDGPAFFRQACEHGLEGVVSKRADSPYRGGRGRDWLKTKCTREQEFVVVGFTDPSGSRVGFGALLLGYHADGELVLAGKVGTGFDDATLRSLRARLDRIERKTTPVADPPRGAAARGVHWVRPELVAQVAFTEWTEDGALRHPSFKGLREDKPASDVVRERRAPLPSPEQEPKPGEARRTPHAEVAKMPDDGGRPDLEGVRVRLTSPGKVLYREQGLTKRDLALYYALVSERMLPHVRDRPLTLVRCPDGREGECFYQKHAGGAIPDAVKRVRIREQKKTATYLYVTDVEGLVSLVQIGALEIHVWGSRRDRLERPDVLVLDLDPDPGLGWDRVVTAALALRGRLADLGLTSFVRTTGGKGLHVVSPLVRRSGWDELKSFARALAEELAVSDPERYTATASKQKRKGRVYIDYLRNARGASAVAPYSTRARPGAPVATPLTWDELESGVDAAELTVQTVPERLSGRDPWADYFDVRQSLTKPMKRELGLV